MEGELELKDLETMIANGSKAAALAAIEEFKKVSMKEEIKKIYPNFGEEGDFSGGQVKSRTGSVLDVSMLRKGYAGQTDAEYAASLCSFGGPYKKLSSAMELWGKLLK